MEALNLNLKFEKLERLCVCVMWYVCVCEVVLCVS